MQAQQWSWGGRGSDSRALTGAEGHSMGLLPSASGPPLGKLFCCYPKPRAWLAVAQSTPTHLSRRAASGPPAGSCAAPAGWPWRMPPAHHPCHAPAPWLPQHKYAQAHRCYHVRMPAKAASSAGGDGDALTSTTSMTSPNLEKWRPTCTAACRKKCFSNDHGACCPRSTSRHAGMLTSRASVSAGSRVTMTV